MLQLVIRIGRIGLKSEPVSCENQIFESLLTPNLEGDLAQAFRALDVEPVDLHAQVRVTHDILLARVELLSLVNVLAAGLASARECGRLEA